MKRLLLTTAIGLALGSAAFAQTAANPSTTTPAAAQAAPVNAGQPASVTLSAGVSVAQPDLTRITESVARMTVKPLRGVDFSVSVGSRVPRELRVYRLPADVVQIVPQYRDYRFLVVEKDIVIVEPSANKIVAILPRDPAITTAASAAASAPTSAPATPPTVTPAPPAPTAAAASPSPAAAPASSTPSAQAPDPASAPAGQASAEPERPAVKKQASRSQRISRARDDARRARAEVRVGQRVPDNVPLYALPPSLSEPMAREYRYTRSSRSYATGSRGRIYYEYD